MNIRHLISVVVGIILFTTAQAQSRVFPEGSTIPVALTETISSKTLKKDAALPFAVAQDIYYNDELVIPQGTPVLAEVVTAKKRKVWGKQGKIGIRLTAISMSYLDLERFSGLERLYIRKNRYLCTCNTTVYEVD